MRGFIEGNCGNCWNGVIFVFFVIGIGDWSDFGKWFVVIVECFDVFYWCIEIDFFDFGVFFKNVC